MTNTLLALFTYFNKLFPQVFLVFIVQNIQETSFSFLRKYHKLLALWSTINIAFVELHTGNTGLTSVVNIINGFDF